MGDPLKTKEFMFKVQSYYGLKYRDGEHIELVYKYLDSKHENYLTCLYSATVKNFSGQYKTLPDIAIFEKLTDKTYEIIEEQKRKSQITDLSRPAITDGDEVDYSEEMKELFDGMDKRFKGE